MAVLLFTVSCFVHGSGEDPGIDQHHRGADEQARTIELTALLEAASESTGRTFLIDAEASPRVLAYGVDMESISLDALQHVLGLNQMTAVQVGEFMHVIPEAKARFQPMPVITSDADDYLDAEWVTKVISTGSLPAAKLLPLLRPLIPRHGHLATNPELNAFIVSAPFGSVKRLESVIDELRAKQDLFTR